MLTSCGRSLMLGIIQRGKATKARGRSYEESLGGKIVSISVISRKSKKEVRGRKKMFSLYSIFRGHSHGQGHGQFD